MRRDVEGDGAEEMARDVGGKRSKRWENRGKKIPKQVQQDKRGAVPPAVNAYFLPLSPVMPRKQPYGCFRQGIPLKFAVLDTASRSII